MSDLVGNPEDRFSHNEAHILLQKRLIESHGLQCGFCTPGFVMSVFTLLRNNPVPTRNELETAIEGIGDKHLCLQDFFSYHLLYI